MTGQTMQTGLHAAPSKRRLSLRAAAMAALLFLPLCVAAVPAAAQNPGMGELSNRVERLQRELNALQRQVYTGQTPPPSAAPSAPSVVPSSPADGGAESDPRTAARNSIRIGQLEEELRRLTGRSEEIEYRLSQMQQRLEQLVADVDRRLTVLEGGPDAAAGRQGSDNAQPYSGDAAPSLTMPNSPPRQPGAGLQPPGSARATGAPPRPLGTIPRDAAVDAPRGPDPSAAVPSGAPSSATASVLPPGTAMQQYDYALSLMLQKQDFAQAETALRAFIDIHPEDRLAGNAHYWLGETYFVRNNYQDAAFAFAESFQKFPKGNKAPDSLLKLGMSLVELDKTREACTAYSRLLSNYPDMNPQMKGRVDREQLRAKCQ